MKLSLQNFLLLSIISNGEIMKKLFTILIATFAPLILFAATNEIAKKDAEKVLETFYKTKTISANFTQRNIIPTSSGAKFNAPELATKNNFIEDIFSGKVYIEIGKNALWDYLSPYKSWYMLDETSISQYDEINNQYIKYNGDEARENVLLQIAILPSSIGKNFAVGSAKKKEGGSLEIELLPKKDFGLEKILLTLTKNGIIEKLESKDKASSTTIITFTNMQVDVALPKNIFKKDIPKNATRFER